MGVLWQTRSSDKKAGKEVRQMEKSKHLAWGRQGEAVKMYLEDGKTLRQMAKELHCCMATAAKIIVAAGVKLRPPGGVPEVNRKRKRPDVWAQKADVCQMRKSRKSLDEIAKKMKCSINTIRAVLHSEGVQGQPRGEVWAQQGEAVRLYLEGRDYREVGWLLGCSGSTVRNMIVAAGTKLRAPGRPRRTRVRP